MAKRNPLFCINVHQIRITDKTGIQSYLIIRRRSRSRFSLCVPLRKKISRRFFISSLISIKQSFPTAHCCRFVTHSASMFSSAAHVEEYWTEQWDELCDKIEATGGIGESISKRFLRRLTVNAPVILLFVTACSIIYCFTATIGGERILGVHDTWNTFRPLQYTSLITHIFAHSSLNHLRGNVTHLLLVGPSVENEFGSKNLAIIMGIVSVVSAFVHILLGSTRSHQLGASGVVFACILLNSLVSADNGRIPVAFVLIAVMYLGDELTLMLNIFNPDDRMSHHAHLSGGIVGAAAGFYIHKQRRGKKEESVVQKWLQSAKKKSK